jgi:hypothetical protein|tara:strand:+ start:658 stop:1020 length:363 start_codon:yes stop_codon:yes gene_type:complete
MIPLTSKEKKIVLIKYIIHGVSPFAEASLDIRIKMLKSAMKKIGLHYDEEEMLSIGEQCLEVQGSLNNSMMDYIKGHKDMVIKAHQELHKGNDSLRKELGDDLSDEGLDVLSKKKWYQRG